MMTKSKLKKLFFSHLSRSIPWVSKPTFRIGILRPFFLTYRPSRDAKLKFIIGGVKIPCQMFDMRAQPVLDVVVESRETIYELPNPEPDGNEPIKSAIICGSNPLFRTGTINHVTFPKAGRCPNFFFLLTRVCVMM
jgi:hypothetical protein